jgi:RNA polymerase sigma-70 factor (ECF subfamily)
MTATTMTANAAIQLVAPAPTADAHAVHDTPSLTSTAAFEAAVHPHLRWLQQWATRLTHDTEAAFDLVQDTLERGYRKRALFQPGTNVRAWLLRIMRNIWISKHRRAGASTSLISIDEVDEVTLYRRGSHHGPETSSVEVCVVDALGASSIVGMIATLPPRYRDVVLLADVEGIGYQDISERLQIPMGSVASRLFRARRLLRGTLREHALLAGYLPRAG